MTQCVQITLALNFFASKVFAHIEDDAYEKQMLFDIALVLVFLITLVSLLLYCGVLVIMRRNRKSSRYKTFFFRTLWNESFINSFTFIFFLTTMYARCFGSTSSIFLFLNRYSWWTKFAQITQEQIMYTQTMNVLLTVGGRFCTVCLPHSQITQIAEGLTKWKIFALQVSLPSFIVIPLYFFYDFQYGYKGITVPLLLGTLDASYDRVIFLIGLVYRIAAFALCVYGYACLFWTVRKKANRNQMNILIHGGCLLLAFDALLACTIFRGFRTGESDALMRLFYLTMMLWIPCTNIVVTICVITPIRKHILNPFKDRADTSMTPSMF